MAWNLKLSMTYNIFLEKTNITGGCGEGHMGHLEFTLGNMLKVEIVY